jgi:hypothetical protein
MDLSRLITEEVKLGIKILAIVINIAHVFISLTLFNFIRGVSNQVKTPSEGFFKFVGLVHIGLILAILLLIIFLF